MTDSMRHAAGPVRRAKFPWRPGRWVLVLGELALAKGLTRGQGRRGAKDPKVLPAKDYRWSLAFSPDGKTLIGGGESGAVTVWDLARKKKGVAIRRHDGKIGDAAVAVSPDGKMFATGSADKTVVL